MVCLIVSFLYFCFPSWNISWLGISIPFILSLLIVRWVIWAFEWELIGIQIWSIFLSFAVLNLNNNFNPEIPSFADHVLRPKAFFTCYHLFARKPRTIRYSSHLLSSIPDLCSSWVLIEFVLLNFSILLFVFRVRRFFPQNLTFMSDRGVRRLCFSGGSASFLSFLVLSFHQCFSLMFFLHELQKDGISFESSYRSQSTVVSSIL